MSTPVVASALINTQLTLPGDQEKMCQLVWDFCRTKSNNSPLEVLSTFASTTISSRESASIVMAVNKYEKENNRDGIELRILKELLKAKEEIDVRIEYKIAWLLSLEENFGKQFSYLNVFTDKDSKNKILSTSTRAQKEIDCNYIPYLRKSAQGELSRLEEINAFRVALQPLPTKDQKLLLQLAEVIQNNGYAFYQALHVLYAKSVTNIETLQLLSLLMLPITATNDWYEATLAENIVPPFMKENPKIWFDAKTQWFINAGAVTLEKNEKVCITRYGHKVLENLMVDKYKIYPINREHQPNQRDPMATDAAFDEKAVSHLPAKQLFESMTEEQKMYVFDSVIKRIAEKLTLETSLQNSWDEKVKPSDIYTRLSQNPKNLELVNNLLRVADQKEQAIILFRIAEVTAKATELYGDSEKALAWLVRPNRDLNNVAPVALLNTNKGADQVHTILGKVAHGIFF